MCSRVQMVWVFIMNRMGSQSASAAQRRRMALGVAILLLVDVIWVASSELTAVSPSTCAHALVHSHSHSHLSQTHTQTHSNTH